MDFVPLLFISLNIIHGNFSKADRYIKPTPRIIAIKKDQFLITETDPDIVILIPNLQPLETKKVPSKSFLARCLPISVSASQSFDVLNDSGDDPFITISTSKSYG